MLNEEQLGFFARNGYVQISSAVPMSVCEGLINLTHKRLPSSWNHKDRSTWNGEVQDSCHVGSLDWFKGALKFQEGDLIGHPLIMDTFDRGASIGNIAQQLLGEPLADLRIRGLYPIFPVSDGTVERRKPHIESHPAELVVFAYLDDVPVGGAGLSVWPGSHRDFAPAMGSKIDCQMTDAYHEAYREWVRWEPIELHGAKGDLIITHHRLLHGPSINRSDHVRYAFLCDYKRARYAELSKEAPEENMWADWPAVSALPKQVRDGPSDIRLARRTKGERRPAVVEELTHAGIKKRDAARLAEMRRDGDVWLQVSDNARICAGVKLVPRGSDLAVQGVRIWINGALVDSQSEFDLFSNVTALEGPIRIAIEGSKGPLYARLIRLALPFDTSEQLAFWNVPAGNSSFEYAGPEALPAR